VRTKYLDVSRHEMSMSIVAPEPKAYHQIAGETETNLCRHVLSPWFPRALDPEGGFFQNYGDDWSHLPEDGKSVVYQSRLSWVAAMASRRYPDDETPYRSLALHGYEGLRNQLWDATRGGFYWAVNGAGKPDDTKLVYGNAFAIYACATVYRLTGDADALALAKECFLWLEAHGHDAQNGGYFEVLDLAGKPVLHGANIISPSNGLKSMNTHIHLLEAFSVLYEARRDPAVKKRLEELLDLIKTRVITPEGAQNLFLSRDWTPASAEDSYGHDIETAYLLVEASTAIGKPGDPEIWKLARKLVDHTLEVGVDREFGGVYELGSPTESPSDVKGTEKEWWPQAEALNALLMVHQRFGSESGKYWEAFTQLWQFIQEKQVDAVHGGWFPMLHRIGAPKPRSKSDSWTECYHQARALMNVTDRLHSLAKIAARNRVTARRAAGL